MFTDISEIPEKVDLAVIAVRADAVPDVLQECIRNGVGSATIISGGFAEVDRKDLQDRQVATARLVTRFQPPLSCHRFNAACFPTQRQLTLSWGVRSALVETFTDTEHMFELTWSWTREKGFAKNKKRRSFYCHRSRTGEYARNHQPYKGSQDPLVVEKIDVLRFWV